MEAVAAAAGAAANAREKRCEWDRGGEEEEEKEFLVEDQRERRRMGPTMVWFSYERCSTTRGCILTISISLLT